MSGYAAEIDKLIKDSALNVALNVVANIWLEKPRIV